MRKVYRVACALANEQHVMYFCFYSFDKRKYYRQQHKCQQVKLEVKVYRWW